MCCWRTETCRRRSQLHPSATNVLPGAPRCSQAFDNHCHGTPVPVVGDYSYSEGRRECPPRVWSSPAIDTFKITLHILSDTHGGFQWPKYILLMLQKLRFWQRRVAQLVMPVKVPTVQRGIKGIWPNMVEKTRIDGCVLIANWESVSLIIAWVSNVAIIERLLTLQPKHQAKNLLLQLPPLQSRLLFGYDLKCFKKDLFIDCGCTSHIWSPQRMFIAYTEYSLNT